MGGAQSSFVNAHLPPIPHRETQTTLGEYYEALEAIHDLIKQDNIQNAFLQQGIRSPEISKQSFTTVFGADAQVEIGKVDDHDDVSIVGPFGADERTSAGQA